MVLPNARHERFAQALAQGMTQEKAYIAAGYKQTPRSRIGACDLLRTNPHIKERVAELMTRNVTKQDEIASVTAASLLREAEEARLKAMSEPGGASAAIAALTAKAKLAGVWIERSEQNVKTEDLDRYSDAQLAALIKTSQPKDDEPGQQPLN